MPPRRGRPQAMPRTARVEIGWPVMDKMIDAQSIVVAAAATGEGGHEGHLLRAVLRHSILLASIVGLIVVFYTYVAPELAP